MTTRQKRLAIVMIAAAVALVLGGADTVRAELVALEIHKREAFAQGQAFGQTGPYEKLVGVARFAVDPAHLRNKEIIDLSRAPKNAEGKVEFEADIFILAPKDPAKGNGAILYDVNNRGNKLALRFFNSGPGGNDRTGPADAGDGFLFRRGYTVVWCGWIGELLPGGNRLLLRAPVASDGGKAIRGIVRYEMVSDTVADTLPLSRREGHGSYNPTAKGEKEGVLTWRMRESDERVPILRAQWSLERVPIAPVKEGVAGRLGQVRLRLSGAFRPGYIYELVCEAEGPIVQGLGFAAVRDLISFLRYDASEKNPFRVNNKPALGRAHAFGVSQSGRFLRHFLYLGFNVSESGAKVFDGLMPHVAGGGLGFFNHRFAQPTRHNGQHEEHLYPGDMFPFTYGTGPHVFLRRPKGTPDAVVQSDGIQRRTEMENPKLLPKVMHTQSAAEYWHRSGSLVHTDPLGTRDAEIPENVRIYAFGGTQHGPAGDPPGRGSADNLHNPGDYRPFLRALLDALDAWSRDQTLPPPSVYPRVEDGNLVEWRQAGTGFPSLPGVRYPEVIQRPHLLDFGPSFAGEGVITIEPPRIKGDYVVKVPKSGADGNDLGTLLPPEVAVPLATYTGWNLRSRSAGAEGMLASLTGSYIPLAKTRSERRASGDPRASIEERYGTFDEYKRRFAAACADLVKQRLLLPEDAERLLASRDKVRGLFKETVLRQGLVIAPVGRYGRSPVHTDAIEAMIVAGKWQAPKAGDAVQLPDGTARRWESVRAGDDDVFNHRALEGGYAYFGVAAAEPRVAILEAAGHTAAYVNGEPRTGDPYQHSYAHVPVLLRAGTNDLLFHCGRGRLSAKLVEPKADCFFDVADTTLPDLLVGQSVNTWLAVMVLNATTEPVSGLEVAVEYGNSAPTLTSLPSLVPLSTRKVGLRLAGTAPTKEGSCEVQLKLYGIKNGKRQVLDTARVALNVRKPEQTHKETFISAIDGSVQYYALVPAQLKDGEKPGLVLTLHGAAVEASGQAACYARKANTYVVAPTNRRPFGFDWEDWGRLDAMEVLDLTQARLHTDPRQTYLTGHSMGGHGVWHLGVTFPDRFAAIGPSAGWVSMWSYAGAKRAENPDVMVEMLGRSATPSDTLALARNLKQHGVYVLHGDKDNNVPVEQARMMKKHLSEVHKDFAYHEQAGAGHWWGNPCVDWPPMMEFFAKHSIREPDAVHQVEFVTANPGISARSHWATIEAQIHQLKPSAINLSLEERRLAGSTENVARLAVDLNHVKTGAALSVELDGQRIDDIGLANGKPGQIWLRKDGDRWTLTGRPAWSLKGPHRYGTFKDAFRQRVVFVYGTKGTPEENAWSLAKARFDAETFWYRGNGSIDVIADSAFDAAAEPDRNVILYGNADSNGAWKALLAGSPVQVERGRCRIDKREETGADLGCLFVRPRPGSDRAVVGVVTGTGVAGMRLTDRLPYFVSGVGYPDFLLLASATLVKGSAGVRGAGFFGLDWQVATGEFVWHD
jgi:poly(3-hydroxybutyrate) depolymerase